MNAKKADRPDGEWGGVRKMIIGGVILAFVLGGYTVGGTVIANSGRLKALEDQRVEDFARDRVDRAQLSRTFELLREEITHERENRVRDMTELRNVLMEILKEIKK